MRHFDPVSLRVFVAICEERSLTEAAERENLTVSAVSKRLAALEEQIGAPLLERGRGGFHLTAAGETLLPSARGLLQSMAHIHANLAEYAPSATGPVRLAASLSALTSSLPGHLASFLARQPNIKVNIDERVGPDVVLSVEEGRADIGVCCGMTDTRRLQTVPYRVNHLVVVAHRDHQLGRCTQVSFDDTLPYDRVMVNPSGMALHLQQRLAIAQGKALRTPIHVKTHETACHIVASNLAIAIVPKESTRSLVEALRLKTISLREDWASRPTVLCIRGSSELSASARLLFESLASHHARTPQLSAVVA
jgi:DNA-binding transcriptional LysR family regulator